MQPRAPAFSLGVVAAPRRAIETLPSSALGRLTAERPRRPRPRQLQPEKGGFAQRSFFYVEGNAYRSDASHGERPEAMRIGDVDERRISYPWPADTLLSHLQNGIVAYEERTASTSSADLVGTQLSKAAAKAAAEAQASDAPPAGPSAPAQTLEAVVINAAFAVKSADEVSVELAAEEAADGDVARALERYLRTLELHRGAVARSCISAFTTGLDEAGDIGLDAVRFGVSLSLEDAGGRGGFGTVARHLRGVAVDEREAFLEFVLCAGDARPTLTVLTVLVACPKLELPDPRRPGPDYEAEVLAALRRAAAGGGPGAALGLVALRNDVEYGGGPRHLHAHVLWRPRGGPTRASSQWLAP